MRHKSLLTKVSKVKDDDAAVGRLRVEKFQAVDRQREFSRLHTTNGPREPIKPRVFVFRWMNGCCLLSVWV